MQILTQSDGPVPRLGIPIDAQRLAPNAIVKHNPPVPVRRVAKEPTVAPQVRLVVSILALVGVLVIGSAGYRVIEADRVPSIIDAVFMTVITLSTVGYGEVWELSPSGKVWTIVVIMFGIITVSYALTSLFSIVVGGELRSLREGKKMEKRIGHLHDHVILCGYGRMGSLVVADLQERGVSVVVVEKRSEAEDDLKLADVPYLIGDAVEEDLLFRAGLMRARALVTILAHDADNVFVTLSTNALRPDLTIIARAENPSTEPKLIRAGASRVVCPQVAGATKVTNILTRPAVVDFVELASKGVDLEIDEYVVGPKSPLKGRLLRDGAIRTGSNAIVVAIKSASGQAVFNPGADTAIQEGDTLILVGPGGVSERLAAIDAAG